MFCQINPNDPPFSKGTTVGATNTASVISTAPMVTTVTSSPSLSPSPTSIQSTTTDSKAGLHAHTIVTQAPTSIATTLGTGQVMVAASGLSAALQGAQLPTSASFAAMAAAAGLSPGLMASSQFAPGSVLDMFKQVLQLSLLWVSLNCSHVLFIDQYNLVCVFRGALLSLTPGGLGSALSPALMSNSTLATIQGVYQCCDSTFNNCTNILV